MRVKKFFCAMAAALILLTSSLCAADDESANAKLARIEIDTYGAEQYGALLDRISRLERDLNGRNMTGNMNARLEEIAETLYNSDEGPGVLAKINALEWNTNHIVRGGGIETRLTSLERQILGKTGDGTFNDRISALAQASYGEAILPIVQVQVPANTLIKVETTVPTSSKTLQEGDIIPVRVVDDVFVDGSLVFVKGLSGEGAVSHVVRAKNIFRNGKIVTDFYALKTIDGQTAETFAGDESFAEMNAKDMARGLSLVGQTFSGKNKDFDEVFVRGKNIDLPAGIELYVQIKVPIVVYGVKAQGGGVLLEDEMIAPAPAKTAEPAQPAQPEEVIIETETRTEPTPAPPANNDDGEIIEIIDEE